MREAIALTQRWAETNAALVRSLRKGYQEKGCGTCAGRLARRCLYCGVSTCELCGVWALDGIYCDECYEKEVRAS